MFATAHSVLGVHTALAPPTPPTQTTRASRTLHANSPIRAAQPNGRGCHTNDEVSPCPPCQALSLSALTSCQMDTAGGGGAQQHEGRERISQQRILARALASHAYSTPRTGEISHLSLPENITGWVRIQLPDVLKTRPISILMGAKMQLLEVVTGHSQFLSHFSIPQAIPTQPVIFSGRDERSHRSVGYYSNYCTHETPAREPRCAAG